MKKSILTFAVLLFSTVVFGQNYDHWKDSIVMMSFSGHMYPVTTYNGLDGAGKVTVWGGTPPINYLWSTGATTDSIHGLSVGAYSVMISDQSGQRLFGGNNVMNVANQPQSNGMTIDPMNGIIYDQTTMTRSVTLSKGTAYALPDTLFTQAKIFLNGKTSGKLDMRRTTMQLVQYAKWKQWQLKYMKPSTQ
jgi:hypothetical protein